MKLIMEFSLPEEQEEFDLARTGADLRAAVEHYDQSVLRPIIKYGVNTDVLDAALEGVELERSDANVALAHSIIENLTYYLRQQLWESINESN